jgi:hypothetical protein
MTDNRESDRAEPDGPARTRGDRAEPDGPARTRADRAEPDSSGRTGAEQEWEPEDLAGAQGRDPTPRHVEEARRQLADEGPAAIEKTVP